VTAVNTPTVTELPRRREPVTRDTFLGDGPGLVAADVERRLCTQCGTNRAATRLSLTLCVVCAGIVPTPTETTT
jgi:hypothetical protein